MSILLVTGPSGAGKDFVSENLKAINDLRHISYDQLFGQSVYSAFPFYTGKQYDHEIWNQAKELSIDFSSIFSTVLKRTGCIKNRHFLIQGVQLSKAFWRERILEAIGHSGSGEVKLISIIPTPEVLLEQRTSSSKPYHGTICSKEKCISDLERIKKSLETAFNHETFESKEDALEFGRGYFNGSKY